MGCGTRFSRDGGRGNGLGLGLGKGFADLAGGFPIIGFAPLGGTAGATFVGKTGLAPGGRNLNDKGLSTGTVSETWYGNTVGVLGNKCGGLFLMSRWSISGGGQYIGPESASPLWRLGDGLPNKAAISPGSNFGSTSG